MRKPADYRCEHGHFFEAWLASDLDWKEQADSGRFVCPFCEGKVVEKLISAPNFTSVQGTTRSDIAQDVKARSKLEEQKTQQMQAYVNIRKWVRSAKDVGDNLATEARAQHSGKKPIEPIRGQCTQEQAEQLHEEGIPIVPLAKHWLDDPN